jgi:hypothetical protein
LRHFETGLALPEDIRQFSRGTDDLGSLDEHTARPRSPRLPLTWKQAVRDRMATSMSAVSGALVGGSSAAGQSLATRHARGS